MCTFNSLKPVIVFLAVQCVVSTWALGQTVYHVDAVAPAKNDGLTWETAFDDLRDALQIAVSGDQVWVARGKYTAVATSFVVPDGVSVFGGFNGSETDPAQRDIKANVTTLLAQSSSPYDGLRIMRLGSGVVDGLRFFRGGTTEIGYSNSLAQGAAMLISGSSTVRRCDFVENIGSAIWVFGANVDFVECDFSLNSGGSDPEGTCSFASQAGAIHILSNSQVAIDGCVFRHNGAAAFRGRGGAIWAEDSLLWVRRSVFDGNRTSDSCPGVFGNGENGGAIATRSCTVQVFDTLFERNVCGRGEDSPNGEIGMRGRGSAMAGENTDALFVNCTIVGGAGVAMDFDVASTVKFFNCVSWNNEPSQIGGTNAELFSSNVQTLAKGSVATDVISELPGFVNEFRLRAGSPGIDTGMSVSRLLLIPELIFPGPPPLFAGDFLETDLDGRPREIDSPFDPGASVDMGAYELMLGNTNNDADIDLFDFSGIGACMSGPGQPADDDCYIFDFDGDNDVDLVDAGGFQLSFTGSIPR